MKKATLRLMAILLVVIMGFAASGCTEAGDVTPAPVNPPQTTESGEAPVGETGDETEQPIVSTKDVLIVANEGDPGTLAPYVETQMNRDKITSTIYETLIFLTAEGTFEPVLATSWDWTDDTHIRFNLREGVTFHNGNPFTADDVLYSLQLALNSATKDIYSVIDGANCRVIDEHTFELALLKPDSVILSRFGATSYLAIVDKETCEADPESMGTNPVGTGPFQYKEWIIGDTVTVERYDGYWGTPAPVKTIVYRKIAEASQRVIELETGGVDFAYNVPYTSLESLKSNPSLKVLERPSLLLQNLYFNAVAEGKPCADVNVRMAIAYAIDCDAILQGAALGAGKVPAAYASRASIGSDAIIGDGSAWIKQDIAKAKEYMKAAGYENQELTLEIYLNADNPLQVSAVEIMANQLQAIGIKLNISQLSLGPLIGFILDTNNPWDVVMFGNGEPTTLLQSARFDKAQCPFLTPHTDEMQEICDRLWTNTDEAKTPELLLELSTYVKDNMIIIPFHEGLNIDACAANLEGFTPNAMAYLLQDMYFN